MCFPRSIRRGCGLLVLFLFCFFRAEAKVQFDVFPGFDNSVRAGTWYPVTIEVFNDGPSFDAVVELSGGRFGGITVRVPVELPTNTRKRFSIPLFASSQTVIAVDGRLLDSKGRVQDERPGQQVGLLAWDVPLLAALPGSFSGVPTFPESERVARDQWKLRVARLQPEIFPDNSISLEGLNSLYLNSARALELKEPQVTALLNWVRTGGQLIVAVDQANDVTATPWLRDLLPATLGGQSNVRLGTELHRWVTQEEWNPRFAFRSPRSNTRSGDVYRALTPDLSVDVTETPLLQLRSPKGTVLKTASGAPWLVADSWGRGQVVLLGFNPEREPLKSWRLRPWFWAKLTAVPEAFLAPASLDFRGGRGLDVVFGAMVDTQQIRKLPIGALLLLLLVYLAVIGPIDQWWLKKINRPMLTWITFPLYVLLFSGLIYFIGYKLRAGQTEWNELQVVDVLPTAEENRALLRGRTFGGLYSPANETYRLITPVAMAAMRGESKNLFGGSPDPGRLSITQEAQRLVSDAYVPVWTSTMNVADWVEEEEAPLVGRSVGPKRYEVENRTSKTLGPVWLIVENRMVRIPEVRAGATREVDLSEGEDFKASMLQQQAQIGAALTFRDQAFGNVDRQPVEDWAGTSVMASFPGELNSSPSDGQGYVWPPGMDLSESLSRGDALCLAWMPDAGVLPPQNQFEAPRSRRGALLRLSIPSRP